jgi:hypothetical protein
MMNNLSESLKKKISDEAEAVVKKMDSHTLDYHQGIRHGYTAAATAILSHPGDYGLAGVWVPITKETLPPDDSGEDYPKEYLIRCKGDDPRSGWVVVCYRTAEQMLYAASQFDYAEYLLESATSDRVGELEQALKTILEWVNDSGLKDVALDDKPGMALYHIKWLATNALKQ